MAENTVCKCYCYSDDCTKIEWYDGDKRDGGNIGKALFGKMSPANSPIVKNENKINLTNRNYIFYRVL